MHFDDLGAVSPQSAAKDADRYRSPDVAARAAGRIGLGLLLPGTAMARLTGGRRTIVLRGRVR